MDGLNELQELLVANRQAKNQLVTWLDMRYRSIFDSIRGIKPEQLQKVQAQLHELDEIARLLVPDYRYTK